LHVVNTADGAIGSIVGRHPGRVVTGAWAWTWSGDCGIHVLRRAGCHSCRRCR